MNTYHIEYRAVAVIQAASYDEAVEKLPDGVLDWTLAEEYAGTDAEVGKLSYDEVRRDNELEVQP